MKGDVKPFRCPDPTAVRMHPWELFEDEQWSPLPEWVPDWDPLTSLKLHREVELKADVIGEQTGLPADVPLAWVVEWKSSLSGLQGLAFREGVDPSAPVDVEFSLPGKELAGTLALTTRLVLDADLPDLAPFVARQMGDVLFEDVAECRLQGAASMFPISIVDFEPIQLPATARWHLATPTDLGQSAMGGLRLYLNAADHELVAAASSAANPAPHQVQLLTFLRMDVVQQLVHLALSEDVVGELESYDEDTDSFGGMLRQLLRDLFDDEPPKNLATQRAADWNRFATLVQGRVLQGPWEA